MPRPKASPEHMSVELTTSLPMWAARELVAEIPDGTTIRGFIRQILLDYVVQQMKSRTDNPEKSGQTES